jgi:hypothetical protein
MNSMNAMVANVITAWTLENTKKITETNFNQKKPAAKTAGFFLIST